MNSDKNSFYFTHDMGARFDPKMMRLIRERGYEGYGVFWALVEIMAQAKDYILNETETADIAWSLRLEEEELVKFIAALRDYGLLTKKKGTIESISLTRRMKALEESRLIRKEKARKAGKASANARSTQDEHGFNASSTQAEPREREKEREKEITAERVYETYKAKVRAGARADAIKSIKKRLGEFTEEELLGCIANYVAVINKNKTEDKYRLQANNFFGTDERFKDYLAPVVPVKQAMPDYPDDPSLPVHLRGPVSL